MLTILHALRVMKRRSGCECSEAICEGVPSGKRGIRIKYDDGAIGISHFSVSESKDSPGAVEIVNVETPYPLSPRPNKANFVLKDGDSQEFLAETADVVFDVTYQYGGEERTFLDDWCLLSSASQTTRG